ncbi:hypothetical protein PROAA_640013 [Candidatus Propionivibrio aalborgensis]|uniref:Zinc ribbon domain-containing protein n=1 Tax=Candidatus Propionivibrio aalborgensis TaxID=1860101 RepID=A0A1A8Y153_9RHOO|nr:hypothetical protein PROAA_640013 [Candidatus Propionivibrio aalborgensis]
MNNRKLLVYGMYICTIIAVLSTLKFIDSLVGPSSSPAALWAAVIFTVGAVGMKRSLPTPKTHVSCPDCKELIVKDARVCKHCGCKLTPSM